MFGSVASPLVWSAFLAGVLVMLALDLGVFHREAHEVSLKEATIWSVIWVLLSLTFNGVIWGAYGSELAGEFLTAYLIEKSLSVDNIFVFVVIFRYMKVKRAHLHRVLFAGILGALILRAVFILVGLGLVEMLSWTLYLFGLFLLYTGIKLLFVGDEDPSEDQGESWVKRLAEKILPVTHEFEGPKFWLRRDGKFYFTSLFVALLMIETADVVFALDSIPAIFGIVDSKDAFIVFSSNVCAVLGLRAMFFLLENIIDRFTYLQYGLGLVLSFVGIKMLLAEGIGGMGLYYLGVPAHPWLEEIHVPIGLSLGVIGFLLVGSIVASLVLPPPGAGAGKHEPRD